MNEGVFVICFFLIGALVGAIIGKRREMGLFKGLLYGLFLNWLGWIIIAVSDKPEGAIETESKKKKKKIILIIIGVILLLIAFLFLVAYLTVPIPAGRENSPIMGIILFGSLGIYILMKAIKSDSNDE